MALFRATINNQMDYNVEGPKLGKVQSGNEERLDSGIDSLKEEDYQAVVTEIERLHVDSSQPRRHECDNVAWQTQITEDGDTLLHLAIIHEAKDFVKKAIEQSWKDPFLNKQNHQRQTPLHLAVITEQPHIVEHLLKAGSDPQLVDECGDTALHIACRKGSLPCFSVLTQACSSQLTAIMATTNYSGHNCLHVACKQGYLSLVESLITLGANINAQEECNGRSPLHLAVDFQNLELVRLLIRQGGDVNAVTYEGYTPYHLTFGRHNSDIQKELYELTSEDQQELPESEDDSSEDEEMTPEYDDFKWNGQK